LSITIFCSKNIFGKAFCCSKREIIKLDETGILLDLNTCATKNLEGKRRITGKQLKTRKSKGKIFIGKLVRSGFPGGRKNSREKKGM